MDYYQKNLEYYTNQHYQVIRKQCIDSSQPFEDPEFKPLATSLFLKNTDAGSIVWKRPSELCNAPRLVIEGTSSMDLIRGEFGSSSFIAACSVLANYEDLWKRVVPDISTQEWNTERPGDYSGVFRFRFWRFGVWIEVVVDDRLPCKDGKLCGVYSTESNEFWSALMEKAYAKLVGCYEALNSMDAGSILQDLTGGIVQPQHIRDTVTDANTKNQLFMELTDTSIGGISMATCWITPPTPEEFGTETPEGLVLGHTYAVNAIKEIKLGTGLLSFFKSDHIRLVRLRNPEGTKEWSGKWSDNSAEWKEISKSEQKKMGLTFDSDGEFWMSFDDFCKFFTDLSICRIMQSTTWLGGAWREAFFFESWKTDIDPAVNTAGGCMEMNMETFVQNPQFRFDITDDNKGSVLVQLQQKEAQHCNISEPNVLTIGFHVIKIEENRIYRVNKLLEKGKDYPYLQQRCTFGKLELQKGRYVVIPTTQEAGVDGQFLLRLYCKTSLNASALLPKYPDKGCFAFCTGYPTMVTSTKVVLGRNCSKPDGSVADIYVLIGCEGEFVKSKTFKKDADPKFNCSALFYRKKPNSVIMYSVYSDGMLCDSFMGQGTMSGTIDASGKSMEVPLFGRGKLSDKRMNGTLVVDVTTSDNIYAL
uniref:Calpain-5-like n=1 Tax=Phallusia mammillata TaxID=59560 RepID=A0A6F9D8U9_9ASCI|nr:calpain-5-like [Phallusia mammillata]